MGSGICMLDEYALKLHTVLLLPDVSNAFGSTLQHLAYILQTLLNLMQRMLSKQNIRPHLASKGSLVGLLLATLAFKALLQLCNLGLQSCSAVVMLSYAAIPSRNDCSEVINGLVQGQDPESLHIS